MFQIGSVTKVFTALLLADMAERGQMRLSDPAARYLPGGERRPQPATSAARAARASQPVTPAAPAAHTSEQVTLAALATHTSGLPRLPRSLRWYALASPRDPYARYPAWQFLRDARRALRAAKGGDYAYSNFGYGLLGYLLGRVGVSPYEALVAERICGPLGLADTAFEVPAAARVAQGHQRGRPVPPWHMGPLAAAGGLYSTAEDLARLLRACLTASRRPPGTAPQGVPPVPPPVPPTGAPLAATIRATLVPRMKIPGGEIGLAWHHTRSGNHKITWHNGMTGGFSSMIAFDPTRRLGVAALANSAGTVCPLDGPVLAALTQEP
jgi:serine-type D-Ala-D-Ala carboxypeptidase/endopeptidase